MAQFPDRLAAGFAVGLFLVASSVGAQNRDTQQSVSLGDADLFPSIRIGYQTNSNIRLVQDNETEGDATIVEPRLVYVADSNRLTLEASYTGAYSFSSESPLEWDDHAIDTALAARFDKRRRASLGLSAARLHQELGDSLTRGRGNEFDEPVTFNRFELNADFGFGATDARGNITAGLGVVVRDYTSLDQITNGRGFTSIRPFGRFGYRVGGSTRAIVEVRVASYSFDRSSLDRDELDFLAGLSFAATGRLSGTVRLGLENVSYSAAGADDATLFIIETDLEYRPRSFVLFTLDLNRGINNASLGEIAGDGDQAVETGARLGWQHDWSARVSSDAFAAINLADEVCPTASVSTSSVGFELNIAVRRWLQIGASVATASRQADRCEDDVGLNDLEYDRQLVGVHVRSTL